MTNEGETLKRLAQLVDGLGSETLAADSSRTADEVAGSQTLGRLARAGFVARGLVYLIVAVLAIELATGEKGTNADQQEALRTIAGQPFGEVLLLLVAVGLANIPEKIRGFGHVKARHLVAAKADEAALLEQFRSGPPTALKAAE